MKETSCPRAIGPRDHSLGICHTSHQEEERLKTRTLPLALLGIALVPGLVSRPAQADITTSTGANAYGTATGTITGVTYDSNGNLASVEFTDDYGNTNTITNDDIDNDITDFGSKLEKAFDNGDEVTITAKYGDIPAFPARRRFSRPAARPSRSPARGPSTDGAAWVPTPRAARLLLPSSLDLRPSSR
ncbi:MAG: hypothetical protein KDD47_14805 [Acidobacteria bacterium]|nr:hypothetical protein [Acidobacteriota bacterium]